MHGDRVQFHRDRSGPLARDARQSQETGGAVVSAAGVDTGTHPRRRQRLHHNQSELLEQQVSGRRCGLRVTDACCR
jgi:hypothetical protein